jgi:hypothetical protein
MPAVVPGLTLRVESDVIAASLTLDLPTGYAVDDYLFVFAAQDGGATAITTATSGWVAVGTYAASQACGSRWFYKRCTSTSETAPTLAGSNDDWGYVVHVVRGVNHSNVLNVVDRTDWGNGTTVHQFTTGTPTTTVNNCLCLVGICGDNNSQMFQDPTLFPLAAGNSTNAIMFFTGYFNQYTAGAVPAKTIYIDQADEGGNAWTICIEDSGSGIMGPDPGTATQVIDYHQINTGRTFAAPSTEFTTIDSQGVDTTVTPNFLAVNADPGRWTSYTTFSSTLATLDWAGAVHVLPAALDLTNAIYSVIWRATSTAQMGVKGIIVVFKDGSGAWAAYQISKRAGINVVPSFYTSHIALGSATPLDSSGTMNWANITKIAYLYQRNNSATGMTIQIFNAAFTRRDCAITGGSSASTANTSTPALLALGTNRSGVDKAGLQGQKQYLMKQHIQFGDGSIPTYVDFDGCSVETLQAYSYAAGRKFWNVSDDFLTMTIKACSACTMKFRNCVIAPSVRTYVNIDSGSSTSASYDFAGSTWSNVTFTSKTGVTINSAIFSNCPEIDAKAGAFSACLFSNSQTANATIKLDAGASLLNCSFTAKNAADYAIRIAAAGTYTLDGSTFSGFTKDINITAAAGTVTLHLSLGQTVPTYQTAGATVVIDQAVLDTSFTNADLANGTTILVRNVTDASTIEYVASLATGTGYTISMVPGVDYTVGDAIEIRMSRKNVDVYYIEKTYRIVTSAGGGDFVDEGALALCPICNDFGLDGEDYATKFDIDEVDDELDVEIAGAWSAAELITWWKWQMTVQAAMEDYWLAWDVQTDGSFRNDVAKISSYLDNTTANSAVESTGRRIWRSDDARPIRDPTSGGGALDVSWREPVTVVAVGSGVLPADITAIADAVWDEQLTAATHNVTTSAGRRLRQINAPVVHDGTAQGAGTGPNQIQLASDASAVNGAYDPGLVCIVAGAGAGQSRIILQYNGTTKTATVNRAWKTAPNATSEYVLFAHSDLVSVNEGLAQGGGANTITLNTDASSVDGVYVGQLIFIVSGTGEDQAGLVTAYNGTTKVATIELGNGAGWTVIPDTTSAYVMMPSSPVLMSSSGATASANAVWSKALETGFTADRLLRVTASAVGGKTSGGPSSFVARNLADTQDQITGTADVSGNRSAVTYGS